VKKACSSSSSSNSDVKADAVLAPWKLPFTQLEQPLKKSCIESVFSPLVKAELANAILASWKLPLNAGLDEFPSPSLEDPDLQTNSPLSWYTTPAASCRRDKGETFVQTQGSELPAPDATNAAKNADADADADALVAAIFLGDDPASELDEAVYAIFGGGGDFGGGGGGGGGGGASEPGDAEPAAAALDLDPFHFDWPFWDLTPA
jgi:hypothetical protein